MKEFKTRLGPLKPEAFENDMGQPDPDKTAAQTSPEDKTAMDDYLKEAVKQATAPATAEAKPGAAKAD